MDIIAIIIFVIALIGGGIMTLRTGMIRATRNSVVEGKPARVIGWLLLLAIPFAFISHRLLPAILVAMGTPVNSVSVVPLLAFCLPLVGCPLIAVVVGLVTAKQVKQEPVSARPTLASAGRVVSPLAPCGTVEIDGVCFRARSAQGDIALGRGVVVTGYDPSWLFVMESAPPSPGETSDALQTMRRKSEGIQS
jgi:membrane-bound ClpP family serine protease